MKAEMIFIRATLFNIVFYTANAVACVLCLPALLLPRPAMIKFVRCYVRTIYFLEKHLIGLDFEIRGLENLPRDGSYIVAAKHQSAYETMKLHILFEDPAVVLKQELLRIPLWGWFLGRTHPIAIDRSQGKEAMKQVVDGARRIEKENRALVIFPQGTRVYTWQTPKDKPYKQGAARIFEQTGMPLIPLALNSGVFWPRKGWIKKPGKVVFSFLPPIPPDRKNDDILPMLQEMIETETKKLEQEAIMPAAISAPAKENSAGRTS